jgi:hypothetical protein
MSVGTRQSALRDSNRLVLAAGAICTLLVTFVSLSQAQSKIARVGVLFIGERDQPHLEAFK